MAEKVWAGKRLLREVFAAAWQTAWKLRAAVTLGPLVLALVVGWFGSITMAIVVFVLTFLLGVVVLAAFRLALQVHADETRPRPYLTFAGTEVKPAVTVTLIQSVLQGIGVAAAPALTATGGQPIGANPVPNDYARAFVANDPPLGARGQLAEKVTARIEFFDVQGELLLRMQGRWAETIQRGQRPHLNITYESVQLDIDANALPHPLDVAMKAPSDADVFAFNDDNGDATDLRLEAHRLKGERFRVRITLRAANADAIAQEYELTNGGVGSTIALTQL